MKAMSAKVVAMVLVPLLAVSMGAEAARYNDSPMVDVRPGQEAQYQQDLQQCRSVVDNHESAGRKSQARRGVRSGAMIGALGGAASGRIAGDNAVRSAGKGLAWGAAAGGVAGHVAGDMQQAQDSGYAVRKCLEGRGYAILDYNREDRRADNW